ncbi:hypothetical protein F5148DRAFT_1289969 [Russula earlei]|uniref:Uncharacterized protein n=1 Tax=Russula earlei TaxID=71964 RepID=A0ACC0TWD9_9AGAM|nr:hypothetical protein F5148DRAFT_1289969 [Russula earlei]
MHVWCVLVLLAIANGLSAQKTTLKGKVVNAFTKEPVPFASVFWKRAGTGITTDSIGAFTIKKSHFTIDTLVVSYVGYENLLKPITSRNYTDTTDLVLFFQEAKLNEGVEVKSKFNKGLRWWKQIVAHKPQNNPYRFNNYAYELYSKQELDLNNVDRSSFSKHKALRPFAFILNNIDSNSEAKPFLPVFLTENLSDYYYQPKPYKVREEIKASETNGIKNETVLQFIGGVNQRVNIYEDYITLFNKDFISPISASGDKYYLYKGADTQIINKEKYFHLLFKPKQEGSNTFTGDCWIHSGTWAIQKISITASATADINFVNRLSIVQEFARDRDSIWLFLKDKFVVDMSPLPKEKVTFIGRKTSTYKNVRFNQPDIEARLALNKKPEELLIADSAKMHTREFWKDKRHEELTRNERNVITMIDTLKSMPLFNHYKHMAEFIVDGHKKLGKIEIGPWFKWFSSNQLEKVRLRFDIGTTEKFNEYLRLYGYLAYGFGDKRLKGKAGFTYRIDKAKSWTIGAAYTDDLDNGHVRFNDDEDVTIDNLFSRLIRKRNIPQKFLGIKEYKMSIGKEWPNNFSAQVTFNRTDYNVYNPLPDSVHLSIDGNGINNSAFDLKLRYAPGERKVHYIKAFPHIFGSEYSYTKLSGMLTQSFHLPHLGHVDYMLYGGKLFGNQIPFMLLEIHPGNETFYYNKQSFNLMNRFEYMSDQYAGFNIEHNFEKKLFNLLPFMRKTKMRQFWNVKTVWGDVTPETRRFNLMEYRDYYKSLKSGFYTEIGTGVDNIWKVFRVDFVWRVLPKPVILPPSTKNSFGVFGSFHLQF